MRRRSASTAPTSPPCSASTRPSDGAPFRGEARHRPLGYRAEMPQNTVLVAVDGSELALDAARSGLALLAPGAAVAFVTCVEPSDPTLVTGTGMAGGVMSAEELETIDSEYVAGGNDAVEAAAAALDRADAEKVVLRGDPGPALCDLARERDARAIVMGSRGRGGIKRALLGSVSDYVVRNAHCPVIITRPA